MDNKAPRLVNFVFERVCAEDDPATPHRSDSDCFDDMLDAFWGPASVCPPELESTSPMQPTPVYRSLVDHDHGSTSCPAVMTPLPFESRLKSASWIDDPHAAKKSRLGLGTCANGTTHRNIGTTQRIVRARSARTVPQTPLTTRSVGQTTKSAHGAKVRAKGVPITKQDKPAQGEPTAKEDEPATGESRGKWHESEDEQLRLAIEEGGTGHRPPWKKIAVLVPGRSSKQCRERWCNQLHPDLNCEERTEDEDAHLKDLVVELGRHWCLVNHALGTRRSDNAVKNRYARLLSKGLVTYAPTTNEVSASVDDMGGVLFNELFPESAAGQMAGDQLELFPPIEEEFSSSQTQAALYEPIQKDLEAYLVIKDTEDKDFGCLGNDSELVLTSSYKACKVSSWDMTCLDALG